MSKIDELLAQYCPDGVGFVLLADICDIKTGKGITKNDAINGGIYPIISGGKEPMGYYHTYNRKGKCVTVSRVGANAGFVNFIDVEFYLNDKCFSLIFKKDCNISKYLFYYLKSIESKIIDLQSEGGVPTINTTKVGSIPIPIPPLPVQEEIVSILDKFTALEAELEAELEARTRQYEYYRNELLSFEGKDVEWKALGNISKCYAGATPKTSIKEYWEGGNIPWMSSGEVNLGNVFSTEKFITQLGFNNSSTKMIPKDSVVIALAGQGKTRGMVGITRIELCTNQSLCAVVVNEGLNSDYLYYFLKTQYKQLRNVSSGDGTRGGLNLQMIRDYKIPVPPIEEQERIVAILDKFDALVNDISSGLPAEILARRQQYEYYRGKLLTFKPLTA